MSGAELGLVVSVFLASAVEAVEAFTIVLAMEMRDRRSTFAGVGLATLALAVLVAVLGPALTSLPIDVLRLVIGGLLLMFGLQWLRKAILRSAGVVPLHDESEVFARETESARRAPLLRGWDGYSLSISFKAVLLEGLEIVFIVLTIGANRGRVGLAAVAALAAVAVVAVAGVLVRAPLSRVPENAMKFGVGVMLTSFGVFWGAEGAGAAWPGGDGALAVLIALVAASSLLMVAEVGRRRAAVPGSVT